MPDIASFHPQIVHFVVALGFVGVILRLVSLTGRLAWTRPAATVLLLLAAAASVAAVESGVQAHGPAERVPGAREAVHEHEELGERTRNLFLVVAALEIAALVLARRERVARGLRLASGLAGIATGVVLYEAAEHGGHVVYSYAGGVGTRSGDHDDVHRLLIAGLYHQAQVARQEGRREEADRLIQELVRQVPDDPAVALLMAESLLRDRQDPRSARMALVAVAIPEDNERLTLRKGILQSEVHAALGQPDSARALLDSLRQRYPRAERMITEAAAKLP